jgi:hypothetical protein
VGLIAKQQTKKKVEPVAVPLNDILDISAWRTTTRPIIAAIIRDTAFKIDLRNKETNTRVGRQGIVASAINSKQTNAWFQDYGDNKWAVFIGATTGSTRAVDWQCDVVVENDKVTVSTPAFRTQDDARTHSKLHDKFRSDLLNSISNWKAYSGGDSEDFSNRALRSIKIPGPYESVGNCTDTFQIQTTMSGEDFTSLLNSKLGFPILSSRGPSWTFGLGLPKYWADNNVRIDVAPLDSGGCIVNGTLSMTSRSAVADLVALTAARAFWQLLGFRVSGDGIENTIDPPKRIVKDLM